MTKGGCKLSLELFGDWSGPVVYDVFHGGLDAEDFVDFAWKKLYDHINPYPGPQSVIINDNATIHHVQECIDFIDDTCIVCMYLACYCPWMNLVE